MNWAELVAAIAAVAECGSCCWTAVAVGVAAFGLRTWRRALEAEAQLELARQMARLATGFQRRFRLARGELVMSGQYFVATVNGQPTKGREVLSQVAHTLNELMEASWEAELVLGDDFERHIKPLEGAYNSLLMNLWLYAKAMDNLSESTEKPEEEPETAGEEVVKKLLEPLEMISPLRKNGEVDELSQTVNDAVSGLLQDLQKHLK